MAKRPLLASPLPRVQRTRVVLLVRNPLRIHPMIRGSEWNVANKTNAESLSPSPPMLCWWEGDCGLSCCAGPCVKFIGSLDCVCNMRRIHLYLSLCLSGLAKESGCVLNGDWLVQPGELQQSDSSLTHPPHSPWIHFATRRQSINTPRRRRSNSQESTSHTSDPKPQVAKLERERKSKAKRRNHRSTFHIEKLQRNAQTNH